jgi:hypothetical protein
MTFIEKKRWISSRGADQRIALCRDGCRAVPPNSAVMIMIIITIMGMTMQHWSSSGGSFLVGDWAAPRARNETLGVGPAE